MASLFDGLKESIVEILQPGTRQRLGEAEALRQMYVNRDVNVVPNTLYRVHGAERGNFIGFSFACRCGTEYQLLNETDRARDYECPACHTKFCIYQMLGVIDAEGRFLVSQRELESRIAKLPIRPSLVGRSTRFVDTWPGDESMQARTGDERRAEYFSDINHGWF